MFMGHAIIALAAHPGVSLMLSPDQERDRAVARVLVSNLGLNGDVKVDQVRAALPPFASIMWRDYPLGLGFMAVELTGKGNGIRIHLVKHLNRFAEDSDPEVQAIFKELITIRDTTLKAALSPDR
jgi:hypothetical protein